MDKDLIVKETGEIIEQAPKPLEDVESVHRLKVYMETKPKKVFFGAKRYPEVDDCILAGSFYGLKATSKDATYVELGEQKGFKASAIVTNATGEVVGGADAYCLDGEQNWARKPLFQLAGMAQTRAVSRALLNILRPVFIQSGVEGTPAEEMAESSKPTIPMPRPIQNATKAPQMAPEAPKKPGVISDKQRKLLFAKTKSAGISQEEFKAYLKSMHGIEHADELPWTKMDEVIKWIDSVDDSPEIPFGDNVEER